MESCGEERADTLGLAQTLGDRLACAGCETALAEITRTGRFFNTVFLLDPHGQIIYRHRKNVVLFVEHSTTPHDVLDQWTSEHGDDLDAFFPVARTEIGNIAGSVGVEGAFPESYRAFALNGAEILYRASLPEPWVSREIWDVQNRARAVDNTAYVIAPNCGALIMPGNPPTTIGGALGGKSMIVGYKGEVLAQSDVVDYCYVSAEVNIEAALIIFLLAQRFAGGYVTGIALPPHY